MVEHPSKSIPHESNVITKLLKHETARLLLSLLLLLLHARLKPYMEKHEAINQKDSNRKISPVRKKERKKKIIKIL